jgi:hypothetical protein
MSRIFLIAFMIFLISMLGLYGERQDSEKNIELKGKVICLDERESEVACSPGHPVFGFKADGGEIYTILPEDPNSRMFEDKRLRQRELLVKAWIDGSNRLEIIKVYAVKDDQLFDVYYFCSICNIKAFIGGLCWCCQEEFEFKEVPVQQELQDKR